MVMVMAQPSHDLTDTSSRPSSGPLSWTLNPAYSPSPLFLGQRDHVPFVGHFINPSTIDRQAKQLPSILPPSLFQLLLWRTHTLSSRGWLTKRCSCKYKAKHLPASAYRGHATRHHTPEARNQPFASRSVFFVDPRLQEGAEQPGQEYAANLPVHLQ